MPKARAVRNGKTEYLRITKLLHEKGKRGLTFQQIRDSLYKSPKDRSMWSCLNTMMLVLTALGISDEVKRGVRGQGGKWKAAHRNTKAAQVALEAHIKRMAEHGMRLNIPYTLNGQKRELFLKACRRIGAGRAPAIAQAQVELEVLDSINGSSSADTSFAPTVLDGSLADFLVNGKLPEGLVLMRKDGVWALGRPSDLKLLSGGGQP